MSKISEENIIRILSRLDVPGNAAKIYIFLFKVGLVTVVTVVPAVTVATPIGW